MQNLNKPRPSGDETTDLGSQQRSSSGSSITHQSQLQSSTHRQEGQANIALGPAFFRPRAQTARELGLLAAAAQRQRTGALRVLETMAGSGIRAVRYGLEAQADFVWANDADANVLSTLQENLERNLGPVQEIPQYRVTQRSANQLLAGCFAQQDFYDLVDIDAFGNPSEFIEASLGAVKVGGLIYLTGTDGRSLTGHSSDQALKTYGFFPRNFPACQEQALRLLIGSLWQAAAKRGFGLEPVFSYFGTQTYRVMVRLRPKTKTSSHYKFLGYCHNCGEYRTISWRKLTRAVCKQGCQDPHQTGQHPLPLTLSGPLWLGQLHDRDFLRQMAELIPMLPGDRQPILRHLLQLFEAEADLPPYYFPLGEIGRRGQMDPPKRDRLIAALEAQGYKASPTQFSAQAFKTDATLQECIELSRTLS